jgi:hypothetical protein
VQNIITRSDGPRSWRELGPCEIQSPGMYMVSKIVTVLAMACLSWSMAGSDDARYIRQQLPIEIQDGKPVTVYIRSLSGNGWNEVGIRCSQDVWKTVREGKDKITVRLLSSSRGGTKIINVSPDDHKLWPVDSFHYLFSIGGKYRANALVEMTLPSLPAGTTKAEVIVLKTPSDTGL